MPLTRRQSPTYFAPKYPSNRAVSEIRTNVSPLKFSRNLGKISSSPWKKQHTAVWIPFLLAIPTMVSQSYFIWWPYVCVHMAHTINECNTSKKCCDCNKDLEYYKDKENKKVFRLLKCSNCVSCENKKIVFRTRDANSSINIMKLTSCWIDKQERPLCFQIPSFTSSSQREKTEEEKVRPS